jgi:ribosome-associated translation inhibitor RaiA
MKDPRQSNARETTVVLVCRDIELNEAERREIERSEAALARLFPKIHRIEWMVTGGPRAVEIHASLHARGGDFEGRSAEKDARTAFQAVTRKLLGQKRSRKEASLGSRRDGVARPLSVDWY